MMYRLPFLKYNWKKVIWTDRRVGRKLTKETKEYVPVERIHTWFRNHKKKNKGGGKRGRVVRKVRHNSHLSHREIVLVTNDDDILGYKA